MFEIQHYEVSKSSERAVSYLGHRPGRHRQAVADLAIRAAAGHEDLDGFCVSSPVGAMITADRAAAWIPWQQRIPYNPLKLAW